MMLDIVPLVDRLVPGLLKDGRGSVVCVCTTRPKYLVFDGEGSHPKCVVEFGTAARLTRTDRIMNQLGARIAGTVPASLYCGPIHNGTSVHIQAGVPGAPWFRVSDGITTREEWRALLTRAVAAMRRLHDATRRVPAWNGSITLGTELRRQAAQSERDDTPLSKAVLRRIDQWSPLLNAVGPVRVFWQHGDFSLNNLLVSPDSIAVIDFEEFGGTHMPLHDAFGLALSVPLSQSGRCPLSIPECVTECVERARSNERVASAHVPALLMHHLLWRINQCHGLERRSRLRDILLRWTDQLADAPETFFGPTATSY